MIRGRLVIDSDVFILLAGSDLLMPALSLLGIQPADAQRLPALEYQLQRSSRWARVYPEGVRRMALAACRRIPPLTERPTSDAALQQLIAVEAIDEGEALVFALMIEQHGLYLASGDKRAMRALATAPHLRQVRDGIAGRVLCLESLLRLLVERQGLEAIADALPPVRDQYQTLRVAFSAGVATTKMSFDAAITGYLTDLIRDTGPGFLYLP